MPHFVHSQSRSPSVRDLLTLQASRSSRKGARGSAPQVARNPDVASSDQTVARRASNMPTARTRAGIVADRVGQASSDIRAVFGNSLLGSKIVGYLDRVSRLQFRQVATLAHVAVRSHQAQMDGLLKVRPLNKLSPEDRNSLFNYQLARHRVQSVQTQKLVELGTGKDEIEALRSEYLASADAQQKMPFVHWCLERALHTRNARPLELALCLPDTNVNEMYERAPCDFYSPLQLLAFFHNQPAQQDMVGELAATLLAHPHINVNARKEGMARHDTPLVKAMHGPNPAVLRVLARDPALDWDARGFLGRTVLHVAACERDAQRRLRLLLPYVKQGSLNINAQDSLGNTALHGAVVHSGDPDNVRLLLDAGADPTIRNDVGRTPYDEAVRREKHEARKILEPFNPPKPGSWQDVLGVSGHERSYETVRKAYIAKARAAHPDKGGTAEAFERVQRAWRTAELMLNKSA